MTMMAMGTRATMMMTTREQSHGDEDARRSRYGRINSVEAAPPSSRTWSI